MNILLILSVVLQCDLNTRSDTSDQLMYHPLFKALCQADGAHGILFAPENLGAKCAIELDSHFSSPK